MIAASSLPVAGLAATWYVSPPPTGNDANPGTAVLPFATVQRGINAAFAGDTVWVNDGVYRERPQCVRSGTAANRITIQSVNPLGAVLDGTVTPSAWVLDAGNVYRATMAAAVTVNAVIADDLPVTEALSRAAMTAPTN